MSRRDWIGFGLVLAVAAVAAWACLAATIRLSRRWWRSRGAVVTAGWTSDGAGTWRAGRLPRGWPTKGHYEASLNDADECRRLGRLALGQGRQTARLSELFLLLISAALGTTLWPDVRQLIDAAVHGIGTFTVPESSPTVVVFRSLWARKESLVLLLLAAAALTRRERYERLEAAGPLYLARADALDAAAVVACEESDPPAGRSRLLSAGSVRVAQLSDQRIKSTARASSETSSSSWSFVLARRRVRTGRFVPKKVDDEGAGRSHDDVGEQAAAQNDSRGDETAGDGTVGTARR